MEAERLNSPHTSAVIFEVLGHQLQFSQDPNSKHLGTTVWDASMVLVKFLVIWWFCFLFYFIYFFQIIMWNKMKEKQQNFMYVLSFLPLAHYKCKQMNLAFKIWSNCPIFEFIMKEKNCRKGRFSLSKLKGKRVIELGAGCGVSGFGMALLGCDVITTDQTEVLPLLMRNVERNTSRILQMKPDSDSFGSIDVAELNWGDADQIRAVDPPFDYIIGTDVVYAEHLLEPLLQTLLSLSGPRTTILLGYELRSTNVHDQMLELWKRHFEVKAVPKAKMHNEYQHPSIQLFIMSLKTSNCMSKGIGYSVEEVKSGDTKQGSEEDDENTCVVNEVDDCKIDQIEEGNIIGNLHSKKLSNWEARRYGAMAARLLRDVKSS